MSVAAVSFCLLLEPVVMSSDVFGEQAARRKMQWLQQVALHRTLWATRRAGVARAAPQEPPDVATAASSTTAAEAASATGAVALSADAGGSDATHAAGKSAARAAPRRLGPPPMPAPSGDEAGACGESCKPKGRARLKSPARAPNTFWNYTADEHEACGWNRSSESEHVAGAAWGAAQLVEDQDVAEAVSDPDHEDGGGDAATAASGHEDAATAASSHEAANAAFEGPTGMSPGVTVVTPEKWDRWLQACKLAKGDRQLALRHFFESWRWHFWNGRWTFRKARDGPSGGHDTPPGAWKDANYRKKLRKAKRLLEREQAARRPRGFRPR